jgi:hypothetical protein
MMAAPRTVFDVRRNAAEPLTPVERTALEWCRHAAENGEPVTRADICRAIGSDNHEGGTGPGVLNRLERKGYIKRTFYQRGVQVCITATGQCTATPMSTATHWRHRDVPTPTIQAVRERSMTGAAMIEMIAKQTGAQFQDVLAELVHEALEARKAQHDC